jgi:hypothetical protein
MTMIGERAKWATAALIGAVAIGLGGSRAGAQAVRGGALGPVYYAPVYQYGGYYGYYPRFAAPATGAATITRSAPSRSVENRIGYDPSTGRTNRPLQRPWMRPLR